MKLFLRSFLLSASTVLVACEKVDFPLSNNTLLFPNEAGVSDKNANESRSIIELDALINNSHSKVDVNAGFIKALVQALKQDPAVAAAKNESKASLERLRFTKTGGDTKIGATVLAGVEDITEKTAGVAAALNASRMLYDGGRLDAKIDADTFYSKAKEQAYLAKHGDRARVLLHTWIDLERYQELKILIDSRLSILDPLMVQLEEVATAGVGDVSQVASAQRTVSSILVAQNEVSDKYEQSKIAFVSSFGALPSKVRYDAAWVAAAVSDSPASQLAEKSPGLLLKYWAYRSSEASLVAVKSLDNFSVGLEANLQRPFGGSGSGSDESIGFIVSKNFYRGDQLESQVKQAEATAQVLAAEVGAVYRDGELALLTAREMVKSMDMAIALAKLNAASSREEIEYLRKQLIIGGSTLESVLSAEARLYNAEAKEIGFIAERRKAESSIAAATGHLTRVLLSN